MTMESPFTATPDATPLKIDSDGFLPVPGGDWPLRAQFHRDGPDLLLVGEAGEQAVVPGFFVTETAPDLRTEGGAVISADLAAKLAGPAAPAQLAQGDADPEAEGEAGDLADAAFRQALANGASDEEAFDAAARAAMQQAMSEGASPEEAAAAVEAAREAYLKALAEGATPEEAMALAAAAADTLDGDFPDSQDGGDGEHDGDIAEIEGTPQNPGDTPEDGAPPPGPDGGPIFASGDDFYGPLYGNGFYDTYGELLGSGGEDLLDFGAVNDFGLDFHLSDLDQEFITVQGDDTRADVVVTFDERLEASTGNDSLLGGDGNTQFSMVQGVSLGGTDTVSGANGTDEITFENLDSIVIVYDADAKTAEYAHLTDSAINGFITLDSVEQVAANDGGASEDTSGSSVSTNAAGDGFRLAFGAGDTGYGYILAGSSGADTITLASGTDLQAIYGDLSAHTINSGSILGSVVFGKGGDDTITGTATGDMIFGGAGNDTLNSGGGQDDIFGGAGNDAININGATEGASIGVFGGAGIDSLTFETNTANAASIKDVETITASGSGDDSLGILGSLLSGNIDLGGGTGDSLTLANGTNSLSVSNTETITGGTGADSITLLAAQLSGGIDLGGGSDSLQLANGTNSLTLTDIESIIGGTGNDSLTLNGSSATSVTGGAGSDTLTLSGSGVHTAVFSSAATNGIDSLLGFVTGTGGDVLDLDGLGFNGAGAGSSATATSVTALSSDAGLTAGTTVAVFDDAFFGGVDSTANLTDQINSFVTFLNSVAATNVKGSLGIGDKLAFILDDSTAANDVSVWHWADADSGGDIDASEITKVASIDNIDISTLNTTDNFA